MTHKQYLPFSEKFKSFYKKNSKIAFIIDGNSYSSTGIAYVKFVNETDSTMFKLIFADDVPEDVFIKVVSPVLSPVPNFSTSIPSGLQRNFDEYSKIIRVSSSPELPDYVKNARLPE